MKFVIAPANPEVPEPTLQVSIALDAIGRPQISVQREDGTRVLVLEIQLDGSVSIANANALQFVGLRLNR